MERSEYFSYFEGDYLDTLCVNEMLDIQNFGKDRGSNPKISETQQKAIENLAAKLTNRGPSTKPKKKEADEEAEPTLAFDLLSSARVILFEAKVYKKSQTSIVQHNSRRHMILLNDVILVTSMQSSDRMFLGSSERCLIHQIIEFDQYFYIQDLEDTFPNDNRCSFEIGTKDRSYQFIAESQNDKKIWLEEIEQTALAILSEKPRLTPGWHHQVMRGTLSSAAMLGDIPLLRKRISQLDGESVDISDYSGMYPIHWAALRGHREAVSILLDDGSNVDVLNAGLNTPLLLAASRGFEDVVELLLSAGADFRVCNMKERDALRMAVLYGHRSRGLYRIIEVLQRKGVDLNDRDSSGATALHECAARNLSRPIQLIVDAGADVNTKHGRNGLTPLQLACTNAEADPETVRSFLDKGAHPNWKDAAGRTAFDMVLQTHQKVSNGLAVDGAIIRDISGEAPSPSDALAYFVQHALPTLMEIVKKGGRYTEESVEHLRPSFKDALNSARLFWESQEQPTSFHEQMAEEGGGALVDKKGWMPDNASNYCLLCLEEFTTYSMRLRRHHCRACGILCCKFCSTKRLEMRPGAAPPTPVENSSPAPRGRRGSDASTGNASESRVCDGCFNRLVFEHNTNFAASMKARKDEEQRRASNANNISAAQQQSNRLELGLPGKTETGRSNGNVSATMDVMSENMRLMNQREEALQNTVLRSEEMNAAATVYNDRAKQLLESQKKRSGWYK